MKVIFFHNTLPSYRIPFFNSLGKMTELKIVFFNIDASQKIYSEKSKLDLLTDCSYVVIDRGKGVKRQIDEAIDTGTDIVHLPAPDGIYELLVCWACLEAARKKRIKTALYWIRWNADRFVPFRQRWKNVVRDMAVKPIVMRTDACLSAGIMAKRHFLKMGVPENKIMYMHYSTDVFSDAISCDIYKEYGLDKSKKYILYLGRIIERKGLLDLLQAFEKCDIKNVQMLVAGTGEGYMEKCREYVASHKINDVVFIGKIPSEIRSGFFQCAEIFVLPSICYKGITEPWGQTVAEALQCGCRVIASDAVGAAFELINNKNGAMYKAGNIEELQHIIENLIQENYSRQEIALTVKDYTCENMAKDFVNTYHYILNKPEG